MSRSASDGWASRDSGRPNSELRAQIEDADLARHLALFYRGREAQLGAAAVFVAAGLDANHRCLYLAGENPPAEIKRALRSVGVDVAERIAAGDLRISEAEEAYLEGEFDPAAMIETLEAACEESVADGYDGLWVAGENTWCFHTDVAFDHVLDFEANFDARCPDLPVTALCQYDLARFGEESTAKALWTHEQIIYRNALCENPFYLPPREYLEREDPKLNAQLMLEQTYRLATTRRQVTRRGERIAVLSRVLRHNIRNDLNVVRGALDMLVETADLNGEAARWLETAREHVTSVVETADKARHVRASIDASHVTQVDLESVVAAVVERIEADYPNATVVADAVPAATVSADANLDVALEEVVANAVVHQKREPPTVTVDCSVHADAVLIEVRNPGETIPEAERRALRGGYETQLEHASGLGLWLVKWVVENSHGTVEFPGTQAGANVVRITLPRAVA